MKKTYYAMLTLLCAVMVTSCSKGSGKLLDAIPANMNMVWVANLNEIVESAGCSISDDQLKLSKEIKDLLPSEAMDGLDEINDILKNSGIDPNHVAFCYSEKYYDVVVFKVNDEKKFANWIEEKDYDEEDSDEGVALYNGKWGNFIALYKGVGYKFNCYTYESGEDGDAEKAMKTIKKFIQAANDEPFSKNPVCSYILDGNAGGLALHLPKEALKEMKQMGAPKEVNQMLQGYICFKASLSSNEAEIEGKIFNEEGKSLDLSEFKKYCDMNAKVNDKALAYLASDEILVGAVAYKDVKWNKIMDGMANALHFSSQDKSQMNEVENYLKNIDGTIAFGFGVPNGLESLVSLAYNYEVFKNFSATMVVEVKDGKAKNVMSDLKDLLKKSGMPFETTKNGFSISESGLDIYGEADGDFIVLSNHKIKNSNDNPTVKEVDFGKYNGAMALVADSKGKFMKSLDLNFDVKTVMYAKTSDAEMGWKVEIEGGKAKGFIAKLVELGLTAYDQMGDYMKIVEEVESKARPSYSSYEEVYDYDWDVDSAAVEEDYYY